MNRSLLIIIFLVLLFNIKCNDSSGDTNANYLNSTFTINSEIIGVKYPVKVYYPYDYDETNENYPTVYATDLEYHENAYNSILSYSNYKIILFIIGNNSRRATDFTISGGSDKYYRFIKEELIPYTDSNYRTDVEAGRTFSGHSYGGLLVLYTLFQEKENSRIFKNFLAMSPSIWHDYNALFNLENEFSTTNNNIEINLYISIGENEGSMIDDMNQMVTQLRSRNNPNFKICDIINSGASHISNLSPSIRNGFQYFFDTASLEN